jgi:hypothetical protein
MDEAQNRELDPLLRLPETVRLVVHGEHACASGNVVFFNLSGHARAVQIAASTLNRFTSFESGQKLKSPYPVIPRVSPGKVYASCFVVCKTRSHI